jgi:hypothetical protein
MILKKSRSGVGVSDLGSEIVFLEKGGYINDERRKDFRGAGKDRPASNSRRGDVGEAR